MTRKQRQSHPIYNDPRNQASLDALLDDEDEGQVQQQGSKPKKGSARKPERPFHFQLRSQMEAATGRAAGGSQGGGDAAAGAASGLKDLQAMFAGSMDPGLVKDVFVGTNRSFPAALDALLAVSGAGSGTEAASIGAAGAVLGELCPVSAACQATPGSIVYCGGRL